MLLPSLGLNALKHSLERLYRAVLCFISAPFKWREISSLYKGNGLAGPSSMRHEA